jgi:thioredoxin-dependent peroxiredoxin
MSKIEIGKKAPVFTLEGTAGDWSLKAAAGSPVVLYFYPRDNTSGCTQEGGASPRHTPSSRRPRRRSSASPPTASRRTRNSSRRSAFPFELLSDPDQAVCKLYDVIQEKSMYGRKYLGIERSTFLIDAKGVLRAEWRKVKVDGHAEAVLAAVKAL